MGFRHNRSIFDQQTTPGCHPAVVEIIVPHHSKFGFVVAPRVGIRNFLGLNVRVQFLLPVLQSHRQIGRPPGLPEKVEIVSEPFPLIELGHGAKQPVLSFEPDGASCTVVDLLEGAVLESFPPLVAFSGG